MKLIKLRNNKIIDLKKDRVKAILYNQNFQHLELPILIKTTIKLILN